MTKLSGDDLWGARCGVLHNGSSESRQTRNKKARKIKYLLGSEINSPIPETQTGEEVCVHIEELLTGLREGALHFLYSFDEVVPPWWEEKLNKILIYIQTTDNESGYFVQTF